MCHADGKPLMVGETGIYADSSKNLAPRAEDFRSKFVAQFEAGVAGELMWTWAVKPAYVAPDSDPDYGISRGTLRSECWAPSDVPSAHTGL